MFNNQTNYFNKPPRKPAKQQRKKVHDSVDNLSHPERLIIAHLYTAQLEKFEETGKLDEPLASTPPTKEWIEETGNLPFLWVKVTKVLYTFLKERKLAPYMAILQTVSYWSITEIIINTAEENFNESSICEEGIKIYEDMLTRLVEQYFKIEGSWYDLDGNKLSLKKAIGHAGLSSS